MKSDLEIIPHGAISSELLTKNRRRKESWRINVLPLRRSTGESSSRIFISYSFDLDEFFAREFRESPPEESRLLVFNMGISTEVLISKVLGLNIRNPERFYVVELKPSSERTPFFKRLLSTYQLNDASDRIFDARIEQGVLRVVSPKFVRMEIPLSKIPQLQHAQPAQIQNFEIDEDGSFIYWHDLDLHLGWRQLQQLINPEAALKASQKSQKFNDRYGKAVHGVREAAKLKRSDVHGLSEKQLRRIEKGDCRLTSRAIEALAEAHKLTRNEYMKKLAQRVGSETGR